MSTIVVGFDFSDGSIKAIDLAIDIAKQWRSELKLVYVKGAAEDEQQVRAEIDRRHAAVAHLMEGLRVEHAVREGDPADELVAQAVADKASLLVVGTHGMSGLKTNMLGRNSYRTIERSPVPVLIVREDFNFNKALETIVVPIDSSDDTRQKVAEAATFAKTFGATIHLLGLYTTQNSEVRRIVDNYVGMVERHLAKIGVRFETHRIEGVKNVTTATLDYAVGHQADLIAIMTEQERSFASLLLGNYAQQMINQSSIPVLTVRPKPVQTANSNY